jgi:hypothetical protein
MSASKAELHSKAETLRKKLAAAEATAEILRGKLAVIQAQLDNAPAPVTGLDLLWKAALPISRLRSSKMQCRTEWNRIPAGERPSVEEAVAALKLWNRCTEWKKDSNQFAKGLHLYIKNRLWEDPPEDSRPSARYMNIPKPLPKHDPSDEITDPAEIAKFLSMRPPRMNS